MEKKSSSRLQIFKELENKFQELQSIPEEFTCRTNIVSEEPTRIIELRNVQLIYSYQEIHSLLSQFGELQQLDSQSLCQKSCIASFYDLRDAINAYNNIQQNKSLLGQAVQAVYLPSPIDNAFSDQVIIPNEIWLNYSSKFKSFGEIKNTTKNNRDVAIRYWDIRGAKLGRQEVSQIKKQMKQQESSLSFMQQITAIKPKKKKRLKHSDSTGSSNKSVRTTRLSSTQSKKSNQTSSSASSFCSNQSMNTSFQSINSNTKSPNKDRKKQEPVNQQDQILYEIDLQAVEMQQDSRTSVMIRNIPNKYNQTIILQEINERMQKCQSQQFFDFFYLPIDFKNKQCNMGYAFINFSNASFIPTFFNEFVGKKWNKFNSEKKCELWYARIQGVEALKSHFKDSSVLKQKDKRLKPLIGSSTLKC